MAAKPQHITSYEAWEHEVPSIIRQSPVWKSIAYRKALFLYDLVWEDCEKLMRDVRGQAIARQVIRSAGSVSANMEEGYGHGLGRDYARILGIALGGGARDTGLVLSRPEAFIPRSR